MPICQGETSVGRYIATSIVATKGMKRLKCEITPVGTVTKADSLDTILEAVKAAHEALSVKGILRVESTLRIATGKTSIEQ